jgi:hypothetical protein
LESVCWGNSTVGSNPTLSASSLALPLPRLCFAWNPNFPRKMREVRTLPQRMSLSTEELGRESVPSRMPRVLCLDVVFYRRGFERVAEYSLLNFMVCDCEAVMLPLVFGPGIHDERL